MVTLAITVVCCFLFWRFVYPPLGVFLFIFMDPLSTPGTAMLMPLNSYTSIMVWGGLLGAAFTSILLLYKSRNAWAGGKFAWRVCLVCIVMFVLIRISGAIYAGILAQNDYASCGPLALIIVLAYLRDRCAWCLFILMLIIQLCLSFYVVSNPGSRFNGMHYLAEDTSDMGYLLNSDNEKVVGSRVQAQFTNTVHLAMIAAMGIAMGIALLVASFMKGFINNLLATAGGVCLIAISAYLLAVSSTRGITMGLFCGIGVHFMRIRGPLRFILFIIVLLCSFVVILPMLSQIPEDTPFFGRFSRLGSLHETESYRLSGMQNWVGAVLGSPILGYGDHASGLNACGGFMPHIGPLFMATLYGLPVSLLCLVILACACMSDLTAANARSSNLVPDLLPLCVFGTICCWTAIGCIMTNGYAGPVILYIALGIAMWPFVFQKSSTQQVK